MLGDSRDIVGTCRGLHRPPGSTAQEVTPFSIRRSGDGFLRMALESVKTETQDTMGFGTKVARVPLRRVAFVPCSPTWTKGTLGEGGKLNPLLFLVICQVQDPRVLGKERLASLL